MAEMVRLPDMPGSRDRWMSANETAQVTRTVTAAGCPGATEYAWSKLTGLPSSEPANVSVGRSTQLARCQSS